MCPLFEEFYAITGCDPNGLLVYNELRVGYLRCFANLFGFSYHKARGMTMDNMVVLSHLIDEFLEEELANSELMLCRRRAFVFCLIAGFFFNSDPGLGDLSLFLLFNQMEAGSCIGGLVLTETFRSLDRTALSFEECTVTPISF